MKMRFASLLVLTVACLILLASPVMAQKQVLYDNGPYNGTVDAWTINFGFTVSDSYTLPLGATVTDFHFVYWDADSSDLLTSVDWCTSGGPLCTPNATWGAGGVGTIDNKFLGTNQFGYEIYQANIDFQGNGFTPANPGFITLGNACTTSGCSVSNPIYWDENSGPSSAFENTVGSIPSEAFTITGTTSSTTTPEPSSIMLFGSGILGLAGVLRRRLTR